MQILGDPRLMAQLQEVCLEGSFIYNGTYLSNDLSQSHPELATAAQSDSARFAELLRHTRERQYNAALAQQREIEHLNADPFNVEAQRRIEEAIRQQAVLENMEHAIEYSPEAFGRVTML